MTLLLNDEKEGWAKTRMGRCATVAAAINAMQGDDMTGTVRHWAAFRRIGTLGRFVESAKERDCREWRFIVRRPVDPADILYLNTTRRYPTRLRRNVGLHGVPYRKRNCFDVSKWAKNDEFLRPWLASGWPRQYLRSRVGGVCLEQAMWAALCANAHGIGGFRYLASARGKLIQERVDRVRERCPEWRLSRCIMYVVGQPAPEFYLTVSTARTILSKARRVCRESQRRSFQQWSWLAAR